MINYICDKCCKEYTIYPEKEFDVPYYKIYLARTLTIFESEINLCPKCQVKFNNFLKED